jgi:alpha 1,3-glucosidase
MTAQPSWLIRLSDFVIGDKLLVHPVTNPGVSEVSVYFPGTQDIWYDVDTYRKIQGGSTVKIAVTMSKVL